MGNAKVKKCFELEVQGSIERLNQLIKALKLQTLEFSRQYENMKCEKVLSNELIKHTTLIANTSTNLQAELYYLWKVEDKAYGEY